MNALDRMKVYFVVNHLRTSQYPKAIKKCQSDMIRANREIEYWERKLRMNQEVHDLLTYRMRLRNVR